MGLTINANGLKLTANELTLLPMGSQFQDRFCIFRSSGSKARARFCFLQGRYRMQNPMVQNDKAIVFLRLHVGGSSIVGFAGVFQEDGLMLRRQLHLFR